MPRKAPIAEWAAQFESSGLTEKQMRTAVQNFKVRREAGTAEEQAAEAAARAAKAAELKKQIVRTDSLCPALSVLCSVE
jgi:hypothetical protein